jgi:hypothetical protein
MHASRQLQQSVHCNAACGPTSAGLMLCLVDKQCIDARCCCFLGCTLRLIRFNATTV